MTRPTNFEGLKNESKSRLASGFSTAPHFADRRTTSIFPYLLPMKRVIHNAALQRYELPLENGKLAYLNYRKKGSHLDLTYSFVPPELRGHGIGRELVLAVFEDIEKQGLTATAYCGYISMIAERHPYWRDKID